MHSIKAEALLQARLLARTNSTTTANQSLSNTIPSKRTITNDRTGFEKIETKSKLKSNRRGKTKILPKVTEGLELRKPVTPTIQNVETPKDHPLWQFFHKGKFIRSSKELDSTGRSWDITELRRKSFDDLHSLWYNCLKERNILNREIHLTRTALKSDSDSFVKVDNKIRETMWKIRHVLNERDLLFNKNTTNPQIKQRLMADFSREYLDAHWKMDDNEVVEKLKRFQKVVFGINDIVEDNSVDENFLEGIKFVANLKMKKSCIANELGLIVDIGEAFILFNCDHTLKSVEESIGLINDLRNENHRVLPKDEIEIVKGYLNQLINAKEENL